MRFERDVPVTMRDGVRTLFEAGSSVRLVVQGHELRDYPAFGHSDTVNRGQHRLFTGGRYDAFLALSVVESAGEKNDPKR